MYSPAGLKLKRLFDVVFSSTGLIVMMPVLLIVGLLVKSTSKGPVLFRQTRVGKGLIPFSMIKFRTMKEGGGGNLVTASGDERITGLGRFLRKTKLDEFPELFNVLRGDMSFVGPRPEVPGFVSMYKDEWKKVFEVKPGITDPATIKYRNEEKLLKTGKNVENYYYNEILPDKIRINIDYINDATILKDINILLKTMYAIVESDR